MTEARIRLYVEQALAAGQPVALAEGQANYLFNVMRLGVGGAVKLFNGQDGEWLAVVEQVGKRGGVLRCGALSAAQVAPPDLWLLFAPIKKARTDFIVEKAVEMGAARIIPVQTRFTNERVREDKLRAHAVEAAEQCQATFVPPVDDLTALDKLLTGWNPDRRILWADEGLAGRAALIKAAPGPWAILIGPEGGFSPDERAKLRGLPFVTPISLGPRILRADTAAVAALTIWQTTLGGLAVTPVVAADVPEVDAFLARHVTLAMFPLTNLRQHGILGDHPHCQVMWLTRQDGGISDVLALTRLGMVLPVLPSQDYPAAARALTGHTVSGIAGRQDWARGIATACTLKGPTTLDRDEPHFTLDLARMQVPEGPGRIVPLAEAPETTIKAWIRAYVIEALLASPAQADREVAVRYDRYCEAGSHVVLIADDQPLAMTGFNARLPQIVQVGGVYTPPDLRGLGHARRALGLHLAQARAEGAAQAVLFSASEPASRAYRAVGFRQVGHWTLLVLRDKEVVHG